MSQPTREHRHEIHPRLCLSYGVISDILWRDAMATRQPVGTCKQQPCGGLMRPREPEQIGARWTYEAYCDRCGHTAIGMGPRIPKPAKGGEG